MKSKFVGCQFFCSEVATGTHRAGRHFRTKLMSRYIGSSPNGWFDVRFEELVSKTENPGGFLRKLDQGALGLSDPCGSPFQLLLLC